MIKDENDFDFINENYNEDDEESLNDDDEEEEEQEEIYTIEQSEIGTAINRNAESAINNIDKRMIKNFEDDDEINDVKMTVSIVAGFPSEEEYEKGDGKRLGEGPKPQNYYKFEYQLTPSDQEPTVTEIVTYKVAAKIFPDKEEAKLVKTWETESQIWVAWNRTHDLKLNKSALLKLFDHEFNLKIWDSKEHCSTRTRFDKPKSLKLPQLKPGDIPEDQIIRASVFRQCNNYLKFIPKELHDKLDRELPSQQKRPEPQEVVTHSNVGLSNTVIAVSNKAIPSNKIGNKLSELAADNELLKKKKTKEDAPQPSAARTSSDNSGANRIDSVSSKLKTMKGKEKNKKEIALEAEQIKKNGSCQVKIRMKVLFADYKFVTVRLDKPIQTVEDVFITITLESPLMSERQLEALNPMMIKIEKIIDLPQKPLSYKELIEKCEPVYCSYRVLKQPTHKTDGINQDKIIHYNDVNVFLAGLLDPSELREYLFGAPFEIEIHDRDRKPLSKPHTPCIFGNEANDENIANVNTVAAQNTMNNPFESRNKLWDPYGIAKLGLEEFLHGKKIVEYFLPIAPCSAPEINGRVSLKSGLINKSIYASTNSLNTGVTMNTKFTQHDPLAMHAGNYLESNAHIYLTVSIAKPLITNEQLVAKSRATTMRTYSSTACCFGRLVCVFDSNRSKLVSIIFNTVRRINSASLNLGDYSQDVQEAALSTYKLNDQEQKSKNLNIITGFHLLDGKIHIIILEGLKDFGLKDVYENIPCKKDEGVKVLYNSSMNFSNRLYASLDVDLLRIKLFEPLENIVKKPLLYIRDMAPKPGVDALLKLFQFTWIERLRDATRSDMFPSAEMIVSMSREFGAPLTMEDLEKFRSLENFNEKSDNNMYGSNANVMIPHTSKCWTPIDNYNENFMRQQDNFSSKDFLKLNVENIHDQSEFNKAKKEDDTREYIVIDKPKHNYSSQKLNTTNAAILDYRNTLKSGKTKTLYSYNKEFQHSLTFSPVDVDELKKEEMVNNKKKWKTSHGWVPRGSKSAVETNVHPRKPDIATIEKLKNPWEENLLHANILESPLKRVPYEWETRSADFNNWAKPRAKLYEKIPVTIFDAGETKEMAEKKVALKEKQRWEKNLVVDDPNIKIHRVLPATEASDSGPNSNNQIDRLKGLCKDKPTKNGLLYKNVDFNSIPAIAVHAEIKDYSKENTKYGLKPGDSTRLRITDSKNVIPLKNNEREKYIKLKNQDFELVHKEHPLIYKRRSEHLTIDEKARFKDFYHSPYFEMNKYELPNKKDVDHIIKLQKESQKALKKTVIST